MVTWSEFVAWLRYPPGAMFFIMFISFTVTLISIGLNKLLLDPKTMLVKQQRIKDHQAERKKLEEMQETNPKKYEKEIVKWERRDKSVQKMQQKMSLERLKPTCITFVPMILIFTVIRRFFGVVTGEGGNPPIALAPMNPSTIPIQILANYMLSNKPLFDGAFMTFGDKGWINYTAFYFMCSFSISMILQRLFKMVPVSGGGMGNMFDQSKMDGYRKEAKDRRK
ncbi:MAG: EMC3/TMCO1 family protein [Promethearchaeota archaeon]